ncbi:MAG TPA: hypothetical protein VGK33_17010, partial [Chloroflexota bacterium]
RPFSDGDNEPYWESPSIDVFTKPGANYVEQNGLATVGIPTYVGVTVTNISQSPLNDVNIEVWVCDFTMGVSPASSLTSSNPGGAPMTGYFAGPLAAGASQLIYTGESWTPVSADSSLNGGHVCIAANGYADNDGGPLASEGNAFKFLCDSHHGQRNIHVAAVAPQMMKFNFRMRVNNPNPRLTEITHVQIQHLTGLRASTDSIRGQLLAMPGVVYGAVKPGVTVTGQRSQTISREMILPETTLAKSSPATSRELLHLTPEAVANAGIAATRKQFFLQTDQKSVVPLAFSSVLPKSVALQAAGFGAGQLLNFNLREGQSAVMEVDIALASGARPGDMHAFDLTQHSPHGDVLGGARIVLVVK